MNIRLLFIFLLLASCTSTEEKKPVEDVIENHIDRYPSGVKRMEGKFLNGKREGKWIAYYESGIKWSEGNFKDGLREGKGIVYYENGKKKMEGEYFRNLKVGEWKIWEEDGTFVQAVDLNEFMNSEDSLLLELKGNP